MKYGYFDDDKREYVITTPSTPLPWINYLGSENFFSLISNTCGGYSFYRDAKLRRITRYRYNNVPTDTGGRMLYIKDGSTVWSPSFMPSKVMPDNYQCRHGLGYSVFSGEKNGIKAEQIFFVPNGENCETCRVSLENTGNETKVLNVFSALEWCLWNAVDDSTNFQRNFSIGEVEIDDNTVYHKTEYRERRNHFAFYYANRTHNSFDTDRDSFLGKFNGWENPLAVNQGVCSNSVASGWAPIACHCFNIKLIPGQSTSIIFVLGYIENNEKEKFVSNGIINKEKAYALTAKFDTDEKFFLKLEELKKYWDNLLSRFQVTTPEKEFNRMVNIWNQYQCMVTFNMSRSASYFESGTGRGMGFRDSCQDLLGGVHLIELNRVRERIIDIASIQFEDGSTYHQYQPLTKTGNAEIGQGFNDDPLWLIACTAAYIKESGDSTILLETVPFNNKKGTEVPLIEHLKRSINFTVQNKGEHGLPLIGRADWNDCLNLNCFSKTPGESFQTCSNYDSKKAESVFIAGMFVLYGREYSEICRRFGDKAESARVLFEVEKMGNAVVSYGWDGKWFLRAYDAFLNKVGSAECEEGKIFIEPQGFCVMAGIGGKDFGKKAMESVKKYLLNDYGVEILTPCFSEYHKELGEITSYPCGYKENGAVFCHNNPWIVCALAKLKDCENAFDIYRRNCPAYIEDKSDIHRTEPYVYSQMIAGRSAPRYGEAKNSWLTGTASWTMVAASQAILGIYPEYDGLRIEPCIPKTIASFFVVRKFRNCEYHITVKNNGGTEPKITIDGKIMKINIIPPKEGIIEIFVEL